MPLITELELAISKGDIARRAKALRLVSNLFAFGSGRFGDEHIALFDRIMQAIIGKVEVAARIALSSSLSSLPDAPSGVIRTLAFDEEIEVAGPALSNSTRIAQADLVLNAQTMGQSHLLAIAGRITVPEEVTDALLKRGDRQVARRAAGNAGARFSQQGYTELLARSRDDTELAYLVWGRAGLPRVKLVKLFVQASLDVQAEFEAQDPRKASTVRELVARASAELVKQTALGSRGHLDAFSHVTGLYRAGELTEEKLAEFAEAGDFSRTALAMSLMCDLPVELVEQVLVKTSNYEQLLVLVKAIDLTWRTTKAILALRVFPDQVDPVESERALVTFTRLQTKTATAAMQFYRLRERANHPSAMA